MSAAAPADLVGSDLGAFTVLVERDTLRLFAQVIGESAPVHHDIAAARAAGHPDLVAPPTYLFALERRHPDLYAIPRAVGVDLRRILHGEQRFDYDGLVFAGDELTFTPRLADYYERRGGAMRLFVRETAVHRGGERVARLRNVLIGMGDAS